MKENTPSLFDAIKVIRFADGKSEAEVYCSQTGRTHLKIGDVGVVIGTWPGNKLRVEAVNSSGAIDWQDHLSANQVEIISATDAPYCRRRINEAWSWNLNLNGRPINPKARIDALNLAKNVMTFARHNVEILVERLMTSGYRFATGNPHIPPSGEVSQQLRELSAAGVQVPIALEAWLTEVGNVDFCGSHPDWQRSACVGILDDDSAGVEPWYSDPLVINIDLNWLMKQAAESPENIDSIEIAPDDVTKAGVSGSGPISMSCVQPSFDNVLIGQHGSFTLLSYLRHAFEWAGFPGFDFIPDAPIPMLRSMAQGLVRL